MNKINKYISITTEAAPLAAFRVFFGLLMCISLIRFAAYDWIDKLYIKPSFHFKYYGFEWVQDLGYGTYGLFAISFISAFAVMLGYRYRLAIIVFFLSFTYIELIDKTTYLNHYYFISMLSFLMIFLPAHAYFSIDAHRDARLRFQFIPLWTIDSIKLLLTIVYFYAGLAKINTDWMFHALPLKIWLPGIYDLPLIGGLLQQEWLHYVFSWSGMLYDLTIPFLLFWKPTRNLAFVAVVVFHIMTRVLFPIGMFPYIMIVATLIFFDSRVHKRIIGWICKVFRFNTQLYDNGQLLISSSLSLSRIKLNVVALFFVIQILLPFRFLCYPGHLFWTEQGYRFSWRVMLMEKTAYAQFKIVDSLTGNRFYVDNSDFLSSFQEKQMATQSDFILEYAHYLGDHFTSQGHQNVAVYVESYASLNGRLSQPYIDPNVDLYQEKESFYHKNWILPFHETLY